MGSSGALRTLLPFIMKSWPAQSCADQSIFSLEVSFPTWYSLVTKGKTVTLEWRNKTLKRTVTLNIEKQIDTACHLVSTTKWTQLISWHNFAKNMWFEFYHEYASNQNTPEGCVTRQQSCTTPNTMLLETKGNSEVSVSVLCIHGQLVTTQTAHSVCGFEALYQTQTPRCYSCWGSGSTCQELMVQNRQTQRPLSQIQLAVCFPNSVSSSPFHRRCVQHP